LGSLFPEITLYLIVGGIKKRINVRGGAAGSAKAKIVGFGNSYLFTLFCKSKAVVMPVIPPPTINTS
jgi:hypothetical protein